MRAELTFVEAVKEAIDYCISQDDSVFAIEAKKQGLEFLYFIKK